MGAVSFRKKDLVAGSLGLSGVYEVKAVRLFENDFGNPDSGKSPQVTLELTVEGEDGNERHARWGIGPCWQREQWDDPNSDRVPRFSIIHDGKSVDDAAGKGASKNSEIGTLMSSLEDAGFNFDLLDSDDTDDSGKPYMDLSKLTGLRARFAEDRKVEKYKDKSGVVQEKEKVKSKVVEILGTPKAKTSAKSNGTAKAKAPAKSSEDLDEAIRQAVVAALAANVVEDERAPLSATRLPARVKLPKAAPEDVVEKLADLDWLEDKVNNAGLWQVKSGKLHLTAKGLEAAGVEE